MPDLYWPSATCQASWDFQSNIALDSLPEGRTVLPSCLRSPPHPNQDCQPFKLETQYFDSRLPTPLPGLSGCLRLGRS